jgi:hypothetical protein
MKTPFTQTEKDSIVNILNRLEMMGLMDKVQRPYFAVELTEFAEQFREDRGIEAMLGYMRWCEKHNDNSHVLTTIMHDLKDRNEELMYPRVMGYLDWEKKENA